ncbi:ABC transporter ATP-binding protein [Ancylobacter dichloromethanicus]|uniref:ABC transporter, ATP-binding protein n=1 Tax=Ancylobacter dichloromethanicus TaxID=518825 RepID=A0A9W6JCQ1_9HYPH|nr:ABC transporter ATP-binding protein [Ancylobacter dichloromethanicus]MBS7553071.1 ABC transporter ATP-binding protein [Ancylobacter dichloromethanicus]GLK74587.1 putative ABC transporter, ATP-binding protein [Ancylobacter dichloromethanicus]
MSPPVILSARGLARHYAGPAGLVRALDGISLDIQAGELVGIFGPSGSGKSTFLMLAGLLETPSAGEVWLAGERVSQPGTDLDRLREVRRQKIGFVFQKANLIPFLTAAENVALSLELVDVAPAPVLAHGCRLLAALDLSHRADSLPARLSGGEQQRVAVARALANSPPLILADEPTAALDSVRGRQVMQLFRRIAASRGTAVAVVTHDTRSADLFDRRVHLEDGRLATRRQE